VEKEGNRAIISGMLSKRFDPSILGLDPNPLALVPIARIMDTERYSQTGIPEAGDNIGIAEYSNANFFSDDTIFSADFPFPSEDSVELGPPETEPKTGELRRYFKKVRDGETMDHLAVPSALYDTLRDALADQEKGLDDTVFQDYANLLIPRAIGYSAGLIDYFFRGRIEIEGPPEGLRGTQVRVKVRNVTPDEESGNGRMKAVVQVEENGEKFISTSLSQTVNLTRDFQEVVFDFSSNPMRGAPEHFLTVIYDGPLGLEEEAVMVGGKTIVRPRLARICDGRNGRRGCPITWLIPFPGATLTIEASGVTNNGEIIAQGIDPDGACLDFNCTTIFPVSFTSLGTQSFTAPTTNGTTLSYFFMEILAEAGGFVCIFDTDGTPERPNMLYSLNWTGRVCPQ
jgi:hypothetical protein